MVLLLDDDRNFREALALLLRGDGHPVEAFADPSCVPPLESLPPVGLLIVDHEMPCEDGLAFADRFHRVQPTVPIVMVTARPEGWLQERVADRPHIIVRHKPIDYEDLARLLPAPESD